jgi:hypothetical protein
MYDNDNVFAMPAWTLNTEIRGRKERASRMK